MDPLDREVRIYERTTGKQVNASDDPPDPAFCQKCGDHVDDHVQGGGPCEIGDCKCRGFEPER